MPTPIDKISITKHGSEKLDRRIKLSTEDKNQIRERYFNTHESARPSIRALADEYGVSRRIIQFTLFPERYERQKELFRERQKDGRYYDKEKCRVHMKEHREYKRTLLADGKLNV